MFGMCPTQPRTIPFLQSSHNLPTVPSCSCVPTVRPYVIFALSYSTRLFSCIHAKSCLGAVPYQLHFPRSNAWFPSSASDLPKIKPRLSSKIPAGILKPVSLLKTTLPWPTVLYDHFHEDPFSSPIFPKTPSLSPSPFPVFRSRFQECPIFGPVFTNARFFDPVFKNARIFGPAFKNSPISAQFFWKSPIFAPVFQDYALFWPWSYSIATVAVAIIL